VPPQLAKGTRLESEFAGDNLQAAPGNGPPQGPGQPVFEREWIRFGKILHGETARKAERIRKSEDDPEIGFGMMESSEKPLTHRHKPARVRGWG
jgi:hypothetical protein